MYPRKTVWVVIGDVCLQAFWQEVEGHITKRDWVQRSSKLLWRNGEWKLSPRRSCFTSCEALMIFYFLTLWILFFFFSSFFFLVSVFRQQNYLDKFAPNLVSILSGGNMLYYSTTHYVCLHLNSPITHTLKEWWRHSSYTPLWMMFFYAWFWFAAKLIKHWLIKIDWSIGIFI